MWRDTMIPLPVLQPPAASAPNAAASPDPAHAILRLSPAVSDPVRIIQAAQIQLRRWRQAAQLAPAAAWKEHVGEIITARDTLLGISIHMTGLSEGVHSSHGARAGGVAGEIAESS